MWVNISEIQTLEQTEEYSQILVVNEDKGKNEGSSNGYGFIILLLLKNRLNKVTAFEIEEKRHTFIEQFFTEWESAS